MKCGKCNSDDVQRLEVIFEHGTQNINTKSGSTGIGFGGGGIGIGFGKTKTKGTSQSMLAQKVSPPFKKKIVKFVLAAIVGLMFISDKSSTFVVVAGFALIVFGVFFTYKSISYNQREYPQLLKLWQDSWMCNKCGNIFHVESN